MKIRHLLLVTGATLVAGFLQSASESSRALAQAAAQLAGQVTSAEEGNMEGVMVTAKKAGSTIAISVVSDADVDMRVPRGGKFIPAPMHYFMRFHGADGMHAGYLPGYPASHGCVRMPEQMAIAFFNAVEVGTPVRVFGRTPRTRDYYQYGPQPGRDRIWPGHPMNPRFDPRFRDPWWR